MIRGRLFLTGLVFLAPWRAGSLAAQAQDSTPTAAVSAGAQYGASGMTRFLLGKEYRELWTTPVTVPVLDLQNYAGGLRAVSRTGGQQTKALRFEAADGRQFFFRSLDKDPAPTLPEELRKGFAVGVVRDQTSSALPTAPPVVDRLMTAAGVLHAPPELVVLPDDERLGEFRSVFAGLIGTLEARVGGSGPAAHWGGAAEIVTSDSLLARLDRGPGDLVDGPAFLKARLFDVMIGDWDRHRDQWRWARFSAEPPRHWRPIPLDRDQAFAKYDGVLLWITRQAGTSQLTNFSEGYPSIIGATWNGRDLDRRLLTGMEWPVWEQVARELQAAITDSVIRDAVAALPPEHEALIGAKLTTWLMARRDNIPEAARRYYKALAGEVDVTATDTADLVTVNREADGLDVSITPRNAPDAPWFHRRFNAGETGDVRLYLGHGADSVAVSGEGGAITLHIVARDADDQLVDEAPTGRDRFYSDSGAADQTLGRKTGVDHHPFKAPPSAPGQLPPRDWGHRMQYLTWLSYGPDLGFFIGAGFTKTNYGFRKLPYSNRHRLRIGFATGPGSYRVDYRGEWVRENSRARAELYLRASGIDVVDFYGLGNESSASGGNDEFYRITQDLYTVAPVMALPYGDHVTLRLGPFLRYADTDDHPGRYLSTVNQYGEGNFGEAGLIGRLTVDGRNRTKAPSRGASLEITGRILPGWWDLVETFGDVGAEATAFLSPRMPLDPTLAFRAGVRKIWGAFPFFESAFIGDAGTVRLGRDNRFGGDGSAYGTGELRLALARPTLIVPTDFGVLGFGDVGRVFLEGESSDVWHTAAGGGIWLAPIHRAYTLSAVIAVSDEHNHLYIQGGFAF